MIDYDPPARQASTLEYCDRWPDEGHNWSTTLHAGEPRLATRKCGSCGYFDISEIRAEVAALRQQLDEARGGLRAAAENVLARRAELDAVEADRDRLLVVYRAAEAWADDGPSLDGWRIPAQPDHIEALLAAVDSYRSAAALAEPSADPMFGVSARIEWPDGGGRAIGMVADSGVPVDTEEAPA